MKKALLLLLVSSVSLNAIAAISLVWKTNKAALLSTSTPTVPVALPAGSLWVLYYTGVDGVADPIDTSGSILSTNDDAILAIANNPNPAILPAQGPGGVLNLANSSGGYAYTRIFNVQNFVAGVTDRNTYSYNFLTTQWFQSDLSGPVPTATSDPLTTVNAFADLGGTYNGTDAFGIDGAAVLAVAIPEPSMLGMLILGLAFVAKFVRRK